MEEYSEELDGSLSPYKVYEESGRYYYYNKGDKIEISKDYAQDLSNKMFQFKIANQVALDKSIPIASKVISIFDSIGALVTSTKNDDVSQIVSTVTTSLTNWLMSKKQSDTIIKQENN